jgi:ATP/maltotriose-dependent transcriptional regulator MalT/DNA-binding SARP family transcriptional activator
VPRPPASLAKTTRPSAEGIFPRTQLFRLLDRRRRSPIVWLAGPPGSGKTSLVASYLDARKLRALWYQVDEGDADVATLFHYLGQAAARAAPRRRRPLPVLTPEHWLRLSVFARRYFRDLYARLDPPFVLVLDNYHEVPGHSLFHDVIHDGLGELPAGWRAIIVSRHEPPASLARLRAAGALEVLGWEVLRLTAEESRGVARRRGAGGLPPPALRTLHEASEGWAAGLVLMLERARTERAAPRSLEAQAPEAVFDYFAGEVFGKADPETRRFLLETAFLPGLSPRMAAALTGLRRADQILAGLHRRHYFTERRAQSEPVYQYHALFRQFLQGRARETLAPAALADLLRRAAALATEAGQAEDAVRLLREAEDWEGLARLIVEAAPALIAQGRSLTLEQWVAALPAASTEKSAWLQYWLGMCRTPFGPAGARAHLARALQLFSDEGDAAGAFSAWSGAVGTILYEWDDFTRLDEWVARLDALRRTHRRFPSVELEARVASTMFAALMFRQPHHPEIGAWAERARTLARNIQDVNRRMLTGLMLTTYHLWMGDRARAALVVEPLRALARSPEASPFVLLTWKLAEAYQHWHEADYAACLAAVSEGLAAGQATGISLWDSELLGQGAYAALSAGDLGAARAFLEKKAAALDHGRRLDASQYHFLAAWEAVLRGDLPRAVECADAALRLAIEAGTPFPEALNHVAMAQLLHERGEPAPAAEHLARARELGGRIGSRLIEFMCGLTEAHLALTRGADGPGLEALRQALALGRAHGWVSLDWWRPDVMARLAERALAAGTEVDYVTALVRRRGLLPPSPPAALEHWPWRLRVHALGDFRLVKDGEPVRFPGKVQQRPLAMLKVLIALGGRAVPAEQLAEALWPAAEGDAAHQALATTLHRLRQLVGDEQALVLREARVSLDPARCWVDVWAFEQLLDQAEAADRRGRRDEARALAERALGLYRGPFLGADNRDPWALSPRERLRRKFLRHVAALGQDREGRGDWRAAVAWYEQGLEVDDLAEEFYQRLMACHQRLGHRAEALAAYERCRRTLAATLGIAPSPETEALHRALRAEAGPPPPRETGVRRASPPPESVPPASVPHP